MTLPTMATKTGPEQSPMRSASSASTFWLRMYISRALAEPTMRGRVQVPP